MVVGGVKRRHMPVPLAQVTPAFEVGFVVLPNTDNGRCLLDYVGRPAKRAESHLVQPLAGRIVAAVLVEPIAVEDGEIHLVANLGVERVKDRQGGAGAVAAAALVVAARKLELEIEQPLRIALGVFEIRRPRQRPKRPAQLMIRDAIVIARVGLEPGKGEYAGVVSVD